MIMNDETGKHILITLESWAEFQRDVLADLKHEGINPSGDDIITSLEKMLRRLNQTYLGRDRAYDPPCWERKPE